MIGDMTGAVEKVFAEIERHWQEQVTFLQRLVQHKSTLHHEAPVQMFIAKRLREMGLQTELWEVDHDAISRRKGYSPVDWSYRERPNLTAVWPSRVGDGRALLLNGHIDVVPATPEAHWTHAPWSGEVRGNRMYGRGAADMKSGVSAMIYAVQALREAGIELNGDVTIETVIEEECTGNGTLATLSRTRRADAAIIPEPFDQTVLVAQVGVLWARIRVRGAGAHVLGADRAVNAILKAYRLVEPIRVLEQQVNANPKRPAPFRDIPHPLNYNVGTILGGDWPSSVPELCEMHVRLSAFPGESLERVKTQFREHLLEAASHDPWLAGHPPEIDFYAFHAEGCVVDESEPLLKILGGAHLKVMGGTLEPLVSTATTDARFFNLYAGIPATCYGPRGGNLHAPDEWVDLESVKNTTKVLALTLMDWCGVV